MSLEPKEDFTQGLRCKPFSKAFFATKPIAIITFGLEVLVHEVIAAITTAPFFNCKSCPSTVQAMLGSSSNDSSAPTAARAAPPSPIKRANSFSHRCCRQISRSCGAATSPLCLVGVSGLPNWPPPFPCPVQRIGTGLIAICAPQALLFCNELHAKDVPRLFRLLKAQIAQSHVIHRKKPAGHTVLWLYWLWWHR